MRIGQCWNYNCSNRNTNGYCQTTACINPNYKDWPDVLPVVHGKWILTPGKSWMVKNSIYKCSVCGNTLDFRGVNAGRGDANYCPSCGAKMDGDGNV